MYKATTAGSSGPGLECSPVLSHIARLCVYVHVYVRLCEHEKVALVLISFKLLSDC